MVAVLVTMPSGVEAIAAGVALASIYPLISMQAAFALIGLRSADLIRALAPVMGAAGLMWLVTWAVPMVARSMDYRLDGMSIALRLLAQVALGAMVYAGTIYFLSPPLRNDLRVVVWDRLTKRRQKSA